MDIKYKSKINKIRSFALGLIFLGIIIMYAGLFFKESYVLMLVFMFVGFLAIIFSCIVYFWIGMLSTKAVQVQCPSCNKVTKMLGRVDACMYCKQPITMDKSLDGVDFDEKYNSKRAMKEEQQLNK